MTYQQPKYHMYLVMSMLIGLLIGGVPLASMVTLYIKDQSCTSTSTTSISTTTLTSQTQINQTNSSVVVNQAYYCAGISPYTLWQYFSSQGIVMVVSTSNCNFSSTPLYFTSMAGTSQQWGLAGYCAIYGPTKNSFTVYANPLFGWNTTQMLSYSQTYNWNVNWYGTLY